MIDRYECESCEIYWEVERKSIKIRPTRKRCPSCNTLKEKLISTPNLIFKGFGWCTNTHRDDKYAKKGMSKDEANEFLHMSIKDSKERMKYGGNVYKQYTPNMEKFVAEGKAKPVSQKRAAEKRDIAKKLTEDAYAKAKLEPGFREKD